MESQDLWIGRELRDRGLVAREDLVRAAAAVAESERAGQPLRLLEALVRVGAIDAARATGLAEQLTSIAQAQSAAHAALAASWADMTASPILSGPGATPPASSPASADAPPAAHAPPTEGASPAPPPSSARNKALASSGRRRAVSSGRHPALARTSSASQRALQRSRSGPPPALLAGITLAVGALVAGGVLLGLRQPEPGPQAAGIAADPPRVPDPTSDPASTPPAPDPLPAIEPLPPLTAPPLPAQDEVARLEAAGRYAEALRRAEEALADPATDPRARAGLEALRPRLEAVRAFQRELDEALAAGADAPALRELVRKIERGQLPPELADLPLVEAWRARVRTLLGNEEYALVAMGSGTAAVTSGLRGDARRQPLLAELQRAGTARVASARRSLAERDAAAAARVHAEAQRALASAADVNSLLEVPPYRDRPGGRGRLVDYDARGFTLRMEDGQRRRFSWRDAPASTACDVLLLALDPQDPNDQLRIAKLAARGGLFARAGEHVARAEELAPDRYVPPFHTLDREVGLSRGEGDLRAGEPLRYAFDAEEEGEDFAHYGLGFQRVASGALYLVSMGRAAGSHLRTYHGVMFDQGFELEVRLDPRASGVGELLLGTGDGVAAVSSSGARCAAQWEDLHRAQPRGVVDPQRPLTLRVTRPRGDAQRLELIQSGARLAELEVPRATWPTSLKLGVRAGSIRIDELGLSGHPDPEWLAQAELSRELTLEITIDTLDLLGSITGQLAGRLTDLAEDEEDLERVEAALYPLPPALEPTSAEDAVCLEGVPARAQAELAQARRWARRHLGPLAANHAREAVALGRRRYWAAEYVLAWLESMDLWSSHEGSTGVARIRLDQAIEALDGFAEALALRSRLFLRDGRLEEARKDVEGALAARPDYPPARLALALLLQREGRAEEALEEARLGVVLGGDHPELLREARQLEAQRDGPSWAEPVTRESEHYTLVTDLPQRADEVLAALEAVRREAPRLFPCLRARPGARLRKSKVLLFARRLDYMRHAYRSMGDPQEDTHGVFDPETGILHAWEGDLGRAAMLQTIRHEATHQWCHALGLELPYWANEAIADYVGGWDEQRGHSLSQADLTQALLAPEAELVALFDLMNMSPTQFYSGERFLHYAQAWSFVHYCLEGGDERAKATLFAYLDLHTRGQAGDRRSQAGASLERIYVQTFHQLDMKAQQAAWWRHVQELGREAEAASQDDEGGK